MLEEAIKAIEELAQAAVSAKQRVSFERVAGQAPNRIMQVNSNGEAKEIVLDPPLPKPRCHNLESVGEIGPFITYALETLNAKPSIWMSPDFVRVILNDTLDSLREETAQVLLKHTKQFALLQKWEDNREAFSHVKFLRMLRRTFSTNIENLPALLKLLSRITQEDGKSLTSEAGRSRASIGTSIVKELKLSAEELPELIPDMTVIPYDDAAFGVKCRIECMLDLDEEATFAIMPLAGQCKKIIDDTMISLRDLIVKAVPPTVPVIYGTP